MTDIFAYGRAGKTPAKIFGVLGTINPEKGINEFCLYLETVQPSADCPIQCEYTKVLTEDVQVNSMVFEAGDIVCGFCGRMRCCALWDLRISKQGLTGSCPVRGKIDLVTRNHSGGR